jgi:hypothetical protein
MFNRPTIWQCIVVGVNTAVTRIPTVELVMETVIIIKIVQELLSVEITIA